MYSPQHFTDLSCCLVHLSSQTGLSRLGEPPPLSCHQWATEPPPTHHSSQPRPKSHLLETLAARNPALSATGSPGLEKPTSCCRQGVRLPFSSSGRPATRPPAGSGRRPSLPCCPRPAGRALAQPPPGRRGRPAASRDPRRPPRSPPTPPARAHSGSRASCGVSASPPQPLTRAGTVLRRRDRAAQGGRGRWPEGEERGARSAPLRPPPPA